VFAALRAVADRGAGHWTADRRIAIAGVTGPLSGGSGVPPAVIAQVVLTHGCPFGGLKLLPGWAMSHLDDTRRAAGMIVLGSAAYAAIVGAIIGANWRAIDRTGTISLPPSQT
jgi:hypothetical protein